MSGPASQSSAPAEGCSPPDAVLLGNAQSEYSTDILFRKRPDLEELMPRLCQYSALYFSASDVMSFLGRKLTGHFQGEVVTDQREVEVPGDDVSRVSYFLDNSDIQISRVPGLGPRAG